MAAKLVASANWTRAQRDLDRLAPGCVRLLEEAGFTYDARIGGWLNIPAGRVITFDRVANRSPEWLAAWLGLSQTHPRFMANGHDVRTVRTGSPAPTLVSDGHTPASQPLHVRWRRRSFKLGHESIELTADAQRVLLRRQRTTVSTVARRLH